MSFYEKIYSLIWATPILFWDFAILPISEPDITLFLIELTNNFAFPKNPKILQVNLRQLQMAHIEKEIIYRGLLIKHSSMLLFLELLSNTKKYSHFGFYKIKKIVSPNPKLFFQ